MFCWRTGLFHVNNQMEPMIRETPVLQSVSCYLCTQRECIIIPHLVHYHRSIRLERYSLSVRVSVFPSVCQVYLSPSYLLSVGLSDSLSVFPSVCQSVCISVPQPVFQSLHQSLSQLVYQSFSLPVSLYVIHSLCQSVWLSAWQSAILSACQFAGYWSFRLPVIGLSVCQSACQLGCRFFSVFQKCLCCQSVCASVGLSVS